MVPLPIVERELRTASRRKSTHRIRLYTTLVASVISFFFMLIHELLQQAFPGMGTVLFKLLAHYAFGMSLLAGIFFAADSVSEEKREGTLGLLFLTDLRGIDVVLGKLASCGLTALYGLVAVMPVLALPLLMGGTTGGQFWRTALALINNLFFALAAGIFISTVSKQANRAMLGTIGLLVVAVIALPAAGWVFSTLSFPWPFWYASPYLALNFGMGAGYGTVFSRFWYALAASHGCAWLMLGGASWLLPRIWQEKQFGRVRIASADAPAGNSGSPKPFSNPKKRRPIGDLNPVQWLMERSGNLGLPARLIAGIYAALALALIFLVVPNVTLPARMGPASAFSFMRFGLVSAFGWVTMILSFLLKIFFAVQACKFFSEARRSGALEIIVSTPLTGREFIEGQWRGLKRSFLWPIVIFLVFQLGFSLASTHFMNRNLIAPAMLAGPAKMPSWLITFISGWGMTVWVGVVTLYTVAKWVTNVLAIGWVGMWLALSSKNPSLAAALTILFVVILPNFVFCLPGVIPDVIFIFWARQQLRENFRRYAFPQQWAYAGLPTLAPAPLKPPAARA